MITHIRVPFRARVLSRALLHLAWAAGLLAAPTAAVHGAQVKVLQYTLPAMPPITQLPPKGSKLTYARPSVHASVKAKSQAELVKQSLTGQSIPLWNGSDETECCGTFDFSMVGTDPTVPQSVINQTTLIAALLIPVKFTFTPNVVFDPRKPDNCGQPHPVIDMVVKSPMFVPFPLTAGETNLGKAQWATLFQKANFWTYTMPGGINPKYQVSLIPTIPGSFELDINVASGFVENFGGCAPQGFIDMGVWDSFLQGTILPALGTFGIGPKILPIFIFENVALTSGCGECSTAGGYHGSYITPSGALQTYITAAYLTNNFFDNVPDTVVLSHEIGEWLDDPTGINPVPAWFSLFNGAGCQTNLEVGDPLTGAVFPVQMPGFTYHVQDLAFKSWFYQDASNSGVNGWGSLYGTFGTPATDHDSCEMCN